MVTRVTIDPYHRKVDGSILNRLTRPFGGTNICQQLESFAAQKKLRVLVRENVLYLEGEIGQILSHSKGYADRLYAAGVYAFEIPRHSSAAKIKMLLDALADRNLSSARALLSPYQVEITTLTQEDLSQIPCFVATVNESKLLQFGKLTYGSVVGNKHEMINPRVNWDIATPDPQKLARLDPYLRNISKTNSRTNLVLERTEGRQTTRERFLLIQSSAPLEREFVHELEHRLDFKGKQVFRDQITDSIFSHLLNGLLDTKCEKKCLEEGQRELLLRELEPHTRKAPGFMFNLPDNDFLWVYGREKSEVVAQLLIKVVAFAFFSDVEILKSIRAICGHLRGINTINFEEFELNLNSLDPAAIKMAVPRNAEGNPSEEPDDLCLSVNNLFSQMCPSHARLKFDQGKSEFFVAWR